MSRILIAALAVSLTGPAFASERQESLTHDGVTYTYSIIDQGNAQVIKGTNSLSEKFRLKVKNGRVTGYVDNRPVAFRTTAKLTGDVKVAAR